MMSYVIIKKETKEIFSMSEKIKSIIASQLNIDESSIKEDTFKDDLGADSLD